MNTNTASERSTSIGNLQVTEENSVCVIEFDRHGFGRAYVQFLGRTGRCQAGWVFSSRVSTYDMQEAIEAVQHDAEIYNRAPIGGIWVRNLDLI